MVGRVRRPALDALLVDDIFLTNALFFFAPDLEDLMCSIAGGASPEEIKGACDIAATPDGTKVSRPFCRMDVLEEYAEKARDLNAEDPLAIQWIDFRLAGFKILAHSFANPAYVAAMPLAELKNAQDNLRTAGKAAQDERVLNTFVGNPWKTNPFATKTHDVHKA